ncbi:MAG: hypothetical protein AAFU85_24260 [Planctomycetota bacterium]
MIRAKTSWQSIVCCGLAIIASLWATRALSQTPPKVIRPASPSNAANASFVPLNATLLKVRLVEDEMKYMAKVFVPTPGETPEPVTEQVEQTYTVSVPYTVSVNGKPVTKMRSETRTRLVSVSRMKGGKYESKETPIPADAVFLTLDGKEVDRKQILAQASTAELLVPMIQKGKPVPEIWKQVLRRDSLILQTEKPIQFQVGP